jgi:hypothetical protein
VETAAAFQSRLLHGSPPQTTLVPTLVLQFDPRRRITVEQALKHPWLAQLHDEAAEPSAPGGPPGLGAQRRAMKTRLGQESRYQSALRGWAWVAPTAGHGDPPGRHVVCRLSEPIIAGRSHLAKCSIGGAGPEQLSHLLARRHFQV